MSLKIHSYPDNPRVWKSLIAAAYNHVEVELPAFDWEKDIKSEAFLRLTPVGKVPVMETPQGPIFESNAIARYIAGLNASTGLLGNSLYEQAQVNQWIDFNTNELEPAVSIWYYPLKGYLAFNPKAYAEAKKEVTTSLKTLNTHLLHHTFLAANHITLADIITASTLVNPFKTIFDPKFRAQFPNVQRWFETLINQTEFSKVIGKVTFAASEQQAGKGAAAPAAAKEEKPKAEKKKEEAKPKEAKPAPAAAASHDGDDEDAPAAKKKHPLDSLPPSAMVLDTQKKLAFSERPIKKDFFELFWPQFDAQGYSAWTCTYDYNEENTVYFKAGNALGGFIQRSDASRKWALGVMNLAGNEDEETGPWYISGAWIWRGTEFLHDMKEENPDSEYYTWTKIDTTKPDGQAKVKEQFFAEQLGGKKVLDRRFFK